MLFLDQPAGVGLSYNELVNVTVSTSDGTVNVTDFSKGVPEQNNTFYVGTYPSQNPNMTTQGTMNSARALWHFAQTWFQEFPGYKPKDGLISIATESYGGRYGPAFTRYFQDQNEKIRSGVWNETGLTHILNLDTLLIINGCIDRYEQWPGYLTMMYNNSYGIKVINESTYNTAKNDLYREGGCLDQIEQCRNLSLIYDPTNQGFNTSVNRVCQRAETFCTQKIRDPYFEAELNYYDVSSPAAAAYPVPWYNGFLNQPHVQQGLGVPLNWTQSSSSVATSFRAIGDYVRPGWKEDLAYLLESGVKVALVYGDRDYACNWYGGELVSLAINHTAQEEFAAAGYADVVVNSSYVGGQVRQYGNLSFTRVYQAGHEVPAYQPETALQIFHRALFNFDIATGKISTTQNDTYSTTGPTNTFNITNEPIPHPAPTCYVLDREQCTEEQWETVENRTALVKNWIVVDANTSHLFPDLEQPSSPSPTSGAPSSSDSPGAAAGRLAMATWRVGGVEIPLTGSVWLAAVFGVLVGML